MTFITNCCSHKLRGGNVLFFALLFSLSSCLEDPMTFGDNLLPQTDFFNVFSTDTLSVKSYNVSYDDLETSQPENSFLGTGYDPYFGNTTAEFVSQLRLSAAGFDGYKLVVDSVRLFLEIANVTGSGEGPHYLSFYEIDTDISRDSSYHADSYKDLSYTGVAVTHLLLPQMTVGEPSYISLVIPNSFGEYLVRDPSALNYNDSVNFSDFFKGLHFKLESPSQKAFLTLSIDPPDEALAYANFFTVYFSDSTNTESGQLRFILDATNENARFNIFKTELSSAEYPIQHLDDNYLDTLAYVHRWGSVTTKVLLPGLKDIKDNPEFDNISITKARLIFPAVFDTAYYTADYAPTQLLLNYIKSDGTTSVVQDYEEVSSYFYRGGLDTDKENYVFNLPTFVQAYLDDKADTILPEMELYMLQSSSNSAVLKANGNANPPRFEISYIK